MSRALRILSFCLLNSYGLSIYLPYLHHRPFYSPFWLFNNGYWSSTNQHLPNMFSQKSNAGLIETYLNFKEAEALLASNQVEKIQSNETTPSPFRAGWPFSKSATQKNINQYLKPSANDLARFFYIAQGNTNAINKAQLLIKTSYVISSATATICIVSTCLPANQFSFGASTVLCRRKRSIEEFIDDAIEPSAVEPLSIQTTAAWPEINDKETSVHQYPEIAPQNSEQALSPSFAITAPEDNLYSFSSRSKRFLFVLTSTITSYSFFTSTSVSSLYLYSYGTTDSFITVGGLLTCRPSNFEIC